MKTVTHVYAHFVTHVFAPCREGKETTALHGADDAASAYEQCLPGYMALSHSGFRASAFAGGR
jgi:hypothetical protein